MGFLALYGASNQTVFGQTAENSLLGGYQDQTLIYVLYHYLDFPPFAHGEETAVVGVAIAALIAVRRRRWRDMATVVVAAPVAIYATHVFKNVAGRPRLVISRDVDPSFPSGHFAVAAVVTVALLIVVPSVWLKWCAPLLLGWTAMIGAGVQSMGWHRPSDVVGSALLVAAVFLVVGSLLSKSIKRVVVGQLWPGLVGLTIALVIVALAVASAWKPKTWAVPYLAISALIATALIGWVALRLCRTTDPTSVGTRSVEQPAVSGIPLS
ncbi:phosphatase PAP2 family protein [Antricoccus suffuscus]|nr:phosphatase PAP2 family protein [Antricoccus suffuscus]